MRASDLKKYNNKIQDKDNLTDIYAKIAKLEKEMSERLATKHDLYMQKTLFMENKDKWASPLLFFSMLSVALLVIVLFKI